MSIQDDIFDVEAALEGKPEEKSFDTIIRYLARLERELLIYNRVFFTKNEFMRALQDLEEKLNEVTRETDINRL